GQAVDASPSLSIVRTLKPVDDLCRLLSWLACASTTDDMRLYLRIADTRVLAGLLRHITAAQRAMLQDTVREWVLADRTGALTRSFSAEASAVSAGAANTGIVLDDLQYNALMQDMEADMLHAELRRTKPHLHISRSGAEIQDWLRTVLGRAKALGLKNLADHAAFAGLALRAAGEFEAAPELADTWFRAKSGACSLNDAIGLWGGVQWQALGRFSNTGPNAARRQG
ncbi:DUF4123 domain-containing protein, partial [Variovorax humicola]